MTFQQKVKALVKARHALGERHEMRARLKLADQLGVSEPTVRNWCQQADPQPLALYRRAVDELYEREVGGV